MTKSKYHAFIFTCNNYTPKHVSAIQNYIQTKDKGRLLLFAYEIGGVKNALHLQGCFWLTKKTRPDNLLRLCKDGHKLHGFSIRVQKGNMTDQRKYILDAIKDGELKKWVTGTTPYVWGEWPTNEEYDLQKPTQGQRNDIQKFIRLIRDKRPTTKELIEAGFAGIVARYPAFQIRVEDMYHPPPESREVLDNI